jgi:hypothetical protein
MGRRKKRETAWETRLRPSGVTWLKNGSHRGVAAAARPSKRTHSGHDVGLSPIVPLIKVVKLLGRAKASWGRMAGHYSMPEDWQWASGRKGETTAIKLAST